jgi:excisionase family DNA binding protein
VTNLDLARVAGYSDTSELKRFLRNDRRLTRIGKTKILKTLKMSTTDFLLCLAEADAGAESTRSRSVKREA